MIPRLALRGARRTAGSSSRSLRQSAKATPARRRGISTRKPSDALPNASPVVIDYHHLLESRPDRPSRQVLDSIHEAYGDKGLGLLLVKNVPEYTKKRSTLLPLIHSLANLPEAKRQELWIEEAKMGVGWIHGKEKLGTTGEPDLLKANFKANPQYNHPTDDAELQQKFPEYMYPNVWPTQALPELESAFMGLGSLVVSVGQLVARQCDALLRERGLDLVARGGISLEQMVAESRTCKARALHYYPVPVEEEEKAVSAEHREWCGWHNDHGLLTGLTSAMYLDEASKEVASPDARAGLVVAPRATSSHPAKVKVGIPADHVAFQIGETAQLLSGGVLKATPHMVRGPADVRGFAGVSRSTFAVFMQPNLHTSLQLPQADGISEEDALSSSAYVPALRERYTPPQDFIQFTKSTLAKYFEFAQQQQKAFQEKRQQQ